MSLKKYGSIDIMASSRDTLLVDIPNFSVSIVSTYSPHACIPASHPLVLLPTEFLLVKPSLFLVHVVNIHLSFGIPIWDLSRGQICLDFPVFLSGCVFSHTSLHCIVIVLSLEVSHYNACLERKAVSFFKHGP